jgi:hypothetical protein
MGDVVIPAFSAIWFGILTSISPCPLATNIVATTYIGKRINGSHGALIAGLFYTIGRSSAYIVISFIIVFSLLSVPEVSFFLQENMNKILGPLLITAGLFVLEILSFGFDGFSFSENFQKRLGDGSIVGACLLGFIFALSFCPISAAFFFGSVIPLSLKYESKLILPLLYGVGTALPVLLFSFIISYASRFTGIFLNKIAVVEIWLRRITGLIFLLVGIYFCMKYIFRVINF